jgi:hypothetical protein
MSTYTSSIKSGTSFDLDRAVTELQSMIPVAWKEATQGSVNSTTGTSLTTHFTLSETVEADELLVFISQTQVSVGTAGTRLLVNHRVNGASPTPDLIIQDAITGTGGNQATATCITVHKDLSGAQTFDVQFARYGGSGTVYAGAARAHLLRFKRR